MTIRVEKRTSFTIVDSRTVNDARLSMRARGVLVWLLDKPDGWRVSADAIARACTEGRDAIRTALKELETHGYLRRERYQDGKGRWATESVVSELAAELVGAPPVVDEPDRGRETSARSSGVGATDAGSSGALVTTHSQDDEPVVRDVGRSTSSTTAPRTPQQALDHLPKNVDPGDVRAVCRKLHQRCTDHHPQHRSPSISVQWVKDCGTLLNSGPCDTDGFVPTAAQAHAMIDAIFDQLGERQGARRFCWADQVNSPGALRRHWVKIELELSKRQPQRPDADVADAVADLRRMLNG